MPRSDTADRPHTLRTDFEIDPSAVRPDDINFSWRLNPDVGQRQTAYRLVIGRDERQVAAGDGDVWDSGRVESDGCVDVPYNGPPLSVDTTYHWVVRVWTESGESTAFSEPATFRVGPTTAAEFGGAWIGHQPGPGDSNGFASRWWGTEDDTGGTAAGEWVQVDLGRPRAFEAVELHPAAPFDGLATPDGFEVTPLYARGEGIGYLETVESVHGFGFPFGYRIEAGEDPDLADATTLVDRTDAEVPGDDREKAVHEVDATARYVRVTVTDPYEFDPAVAEQIVGREGGDLWGTAEVQPDRVYEEYSSWTAFALAALAVRDAEGADLAVGADVTASSSRETDTWGRSRLVDGAYNPQPAAESPLLRTTVELSNPVERAHVHVAALGYGELYLNGDRVGDAVLDPGWTDYDERIPYVTYEIGDRLHEGTNAIGLWLGRGFFGRSELNWTGFGSPRARLRLTVEYADGTTRTVASGPDWTATDSPVRANDVYDGERYDARRERSLDGWTTPDFDDADWTDAAPMPAPGGQLSPQRVEPVRVTETFDAETVEQRDDDYLIDFGQNFTGWVELDIEGARAGDEVRLSHAEIRDDEGDLSTVDLRSAEATDTYVARGDGPETYEPRFTYHGFQHVRVRGYPGDLTAADVTGKAVHTDLDRIGEFRCSNDELNRVQHSAEWSLRGNAVAIPTGCAQRGERTGWTGDAHLSARALLFNFDARRFHEKWQRDHDAAQSPHGYLPDTVPHATGRIPADPAWGVTRVLLPWFLYRHYGDERVLKRHYDGMARYVDFWHDVAATNDGLVPEEVGYYGDWLAFEYRDDRDDRVGRPRSLFGTAYHYQATVTLSRIAGVLGNEADERAYAEAAVETAAAFNDSFFDPGSGRYDPTTQAAQAIPLQFGLVPAGRETAVADTLASLVREADGRLMTGFLGTPALIHVLADHGHADLAYEVVSQPDQPGWVYMVNNGVTTTLWERWDSDDQVGSGMNSFNHHQFAYVSEWFYEQLAGIRLDGNPDAGTSIDRVEIAPRVVSGLDWAVGSLATPHGELESRWEGGDERLELNITVPWNTTASVQVPARPDAATVRLAGDPVWRDGRPVAGATREKGVEAIRAAEDAVEVVLGAGEYGLERDQ